MLDLAAVLGRVPDHERFRSWSELRDGTVALARELPGIACVETVGVSSEGRPISICFASATAGADCSSSGRRIRTSRSAR